MAGIPIRVYPGEDRELIERSLRAIRESLELLRAIPDFEPPQIVPQPPGAASPQPAASGEAPSGAS